MIPLNSRLLITAIIAACALPVFAQPASSPQAKVARKSAFPTVAATSTNVQNAIHATNLRRARLNLNKSATFVGTVTEVFIHPSGQRVMLDFSPNFTMAVMGRVDATNYKLFPDLSQLLGNRILMTGKVIHYKNQTHIVLTSPSAIRLVK